MDLGDAVMDDRRKKLLYRASRRGFKEADLVVGAFAEAWLPRLTEAQLDEFERLLEVPDLDLYPWITSGATPEPAYDGEVLQLMRSFRYFARSAGEARARVEQD
jgi:antitoxin CptB